MCVCVRAGFMELTWIGGVEPGNLHANRGQESLRGLKVLNCSLESKIKIESKRERRHRNGM